VFVQDSTLNSIRNSEKDNNIHNSNENSITEQSRSKVYEMTIPNDIYSGLRDAYSNHHKNDTQTQPSNSNIKDNDNDNDNDDDEVQIFGEIFYT
jgi:hypothetical protein